MFEQDDARNYVYKRMKGSNCQSNLDQLTIIDKPGSYLYFQRVSEEPTLAYPLFEGPAKPFI